MPALLLLLTLIPAPKVEPPKPNPLIGGYALDWGNIQQSTILKADGTCDSPEFGTGVWSQDNEGFVWFSERGDTEQYVMHFDLETGQGVGWKAGDDGTLYGPVTVRIRRGERLPHPRVFE